MMRFSTGLAAAFFAAAFAGAPAQAYTPESGIWWNPNESGTGVVIEVQDNLMVVAAYVGDTNGNATWYTATAFLQGNALFEGSLDLTEGSQCIGCPYLGLPTVVPGAGGDLTIVFDPDDETRAALTWDNGRTIPIERFEFYTRRPEDGATPVDITKMLGEWQWVLDFSNGDTVNLSPYYGEVLVFDQYEFNTQDQRWYYDGCRPDDSLIGGCSVGDDGALSLHSASGWYDPEDNLQIIVVDDSAENYALYVARIGTNDGEGEVTIYRKGTQPGDNAFPARAWRSASRTYVQEGVGPNKRATSGTTRRPGLGDLLSVDGRLPGKRVATASKFDLTALTPVIAELERRLEERTQR
ncbi:hypothetical protein [Chiayiivirga flava]|uniref:Uncharacterized protein n=1 Tax=Chiayiivirga flava TaxID=659595 RepID=A0A7W8FYL7_9GAMM|nr:hypothetical protein [Chiayiivirga flava]MBB5207532.1 hypothetical protein [Chiayiivirga flava]